MSETRIKAHEIIKGDELNRAEEYWLVVKKWMTDLPVYSDNPEFSSVEFVVLDVIGESDGNSRLLFIKPDEQVLIVERPKSYDSV